MEQLKSGGIREENSLIDTKYRVSQRWVTVRLRKKHIVSLHSFPLTT